MKRFFANINSGGAYCVNSHDDHTHESGTGKYSDLGRRISPDGRFIAFDSYADLKNENGGTNFTSFALYLYDTTLNTFQRRPEKRRDRPPEEATWLDIQGLLSTQVTI
jgi:hypothetical protein